MITTGLLLTGDVFFYNAVAIGILKMQITSISTSFVLKLKCWIISVCMMSASLHCVPVYAQGEDVDINVPEITQEQSLSGVQGEPQTFIVNVVDDRGIDSVTLFYRFNETDEFIVEPMLPTGQQFKATVSTANNDSNSIRPAFLRSKTHPKRKILSLRYQSSNQITRLWWSDPHTSPIHTSGMMH